MLKRQLRGLDLLAKQDENTASSLNSLSLALEGQQKYNDEEKLLSRLLTMFEANKSFDRDKSGSALKDYSDVLKKLNRDSEAQLVAERLQKLSAADSTTKQSAASDEKAAEKNSGDSSKIDPAK